MKFGFVGPENDAGTALWRIFPCFCVPIALPFLQTTRPKPLLKEDVSVAVLPTPSLAGAGSIGPIVLIPLHDVAFDRPRWVRRYYHIVRSSTPYPKQYGSSSRCTIVFGVTHRRSPGHLHLHGSLCDRASIEALIGSFESVLILLTAVHCLYCTVLPIRPCPSLFHRSIPLSLDACLPALMSVVFSKSCAPRFSQKMQGRAVKGTSRLKVHRGYLKRGKGCPAGTPPLRGRQVYTPLRQASKICCD